MGRPEDDALREKLSEEQYEVTQCSATEPPFTGKYVNHKADGTYRCVCCDAPLFSSEHKYDSGSGWPSFWLPLAGEAVTTKRDTSHGMIRISGTFSRMARNQPVCDTASTPLRSTSRTRSHEPFHRTSRGWRLPGRLRI